jgi:hypothetical protein
MIDERLMRRMTVVYGRPKGRHFFRLRIFAHFGTPVGAGAVEFDLAPLGLNHGRRQLVAALVFESHWFTSVWVLVLMRADPTCSRRRLGLPVFNIEQ